MHISFRRCAVFMMLFFALLAANRTHAQAPTWVETCKREHDAASLAECLWELEKVFAQGSRTVDQYTSYVPPAAALSVGTVFYNMFSELTGSVAQCWSLQNDLKNALQQIERATRTKLSYRPESCADLRILFETVTTLSPLWTKCPSSSDPSQALTPCLRAYLDTTGREAAIRRFYQIAGETPAGRDRSILFKSQDETLKLLASFSRSAGPSVVAEALECVRSNRKLGPLHLNYALMATGSSETRIPIHEVGERVTCRDIVEAAAALRLPGAPTVEDYVKAVPGAEAVKAAQRALRCKRGERAPSNEDMKVAMDHWLADHCNAQSSWIAALADVENNPMAAIGLAVGALEFLKSSPGTCRMRAVSILYTFSWDVMTAQDCVSVPGGYVCKSTNQLKCSTDLQTTNPQRDAFDCALWRSLRLPRIFASFNQNTCEWEASPVPKSR